MYIPESSANPQLPLVSRRRFVQGVAAASVIAAFGPKVLSAFGESAPRTPEVLSGQHFELNIDRLPVNFTGRSALATAINGSVPGPTLRFREGETVNIAVTNHLKESTSIHWHGFRIPAAMDGVPGLTYRGIDAGSTFNYKFKLEQSGTYWYHSHSRFQEQTGIIGSIIIAPARKEDVHYDREYVVMLSDWTDTDPEVLFSNLKQQSDYYNHGRQTVGNFLSAAKKNGFQKTVSDRLAWAHMGMSPTDILDVTGATYTYLINGNTPDPFNPVLAHPPACPLEQRRDPAIAIAAILGRQRHDGLGECIFVVPLRRPVALAATWLLHHTARQPLAHPMRLPRMDHRIAPSFRA